MEIEILYIQGYTQRAIPCKLNILLNTVKCYLDSDTYVPKYKSRQNQESKLDIFKEYINDSISKTHPNQLFGMVLFQVFKEVKYRGGITLLRDYIREEVYFSAEKVIIRFETDPYKQIQVDWEQMRGGKNYYMHLSVLWGIRACYLSC